MTTGTVLAIAIPVLVVLAAVAIVTTARREGYGAATLIREARRADRSAVDLVPVADVEAEARQRYGTLLVKEREEEAPPAPPPPRDSEEVGITRRQLFNRGIVAAGGVAFGAFGTAVLAFLWPSGVGGFGSKIAAGKLGEILDSIASDKAPFYVPEARAYLAPYPADALPRAKQVYDDRLVPGMEAGLVALFQKCPHLGCRVPWCPTSQWFECPCHGSKYNRVGEKRGGPAPRGMDRFPIELDGDRVVIDTGTLIIGPAVGTNTTGQEPEGPHCV